ncbi:MAG: hypothetical protein GX023_01445 [Tissierellia bacterium]|nr:hypothetical protein [Tissierellia bacterium]
MSYILSAGSVTMPTPMEQEQLALDLGITEVEGVVVHGVITDCETEEPIEGAIVKAFFTNPNTTELEGITHTFSGCDGNYMLYIPPTVEIEDPENPEEMISHSLEGEEIIIQAVGSENVGEPCECPEVPT